jgi:uncharacterized membrane protein
MNIVLMIIGVLALLTAILALLAPKEMVVEESVAVNKPKDQVFDYIRLVKNQDNFSKWNMTDPNMKKSYKGTDGQVGFVYAWNSETNNNVGAGEQEIKAVNQDGTIDFELRFERPMKNVAQAKMTAEAMSPTQTKVTWMFYGPTKFPMSIMTPMFRKMLGKDMATSLNNLKTLLEK